MAKPGKAKRNRAHSDRKHELKRRYGMTPLEYESLLAKQGGVCAICFYAPKPDEKQLAVDHSHRSKAVRGLLCSYCNMGLGHFKDSPKLLRRAASYLTKVLLSGIIKEESAKKADPGRSTT